jgi:hypothetical protein
VAQKYEPAANAIKMTMPAMRAGSRFMFFSHLVSVDDEQRSVIGWPNFTASDGLQ